MKNRDISQFLTSQIELEISLNNLETSLNDLEISLKNLKYHQFWNRC